MGKVAWLYDQKRHEAANGAGRNYWPIYTAEILDWLGVPAEVLSPQDMQNAELLAGVSVLFLGRDAAESLGGFESALEPWVRSGGLLVGFLPVGLEGLFGVRPRGMHPQGDNPFATNTTFGWEPTAWTRGIGSPLKPCEPLPVVSDRMLLKRVVAPRAKALGASSEGPAVVYRRMGRGATLYFAFDPAQTAWAVRQGRPVVADYDGDGWPYRLTDGMVTGMRLVKGLVVDEVLFLLERILAGSGVASIDRLPPVDGQPADMLLYWTGDDEGQNAGQQIFASDFMKSRGLPYHVNVMPKGGKEFGLSVEDASKILANGHELSVHFDFVSNWNRPDYSPADLERQCRMFVDRYGLKPKVYVAHCLRWCGWDETPLALEALGMLGENHRVGIDTPLGVSNPCDRIGHGWGTVFPFYYRAGHAQGNRRIRFLSMPVQCYEMGYDSTTDTNDYTHVRVQLDLALRYRLTTCMFYHPCCIHGHESCRRAIDEVLRYTRSRGARVVQTAADALAQWWMDRSNTHLEDGREGRRRTIRVRCDCTSGVTLRVPRSGGTRSLDVAVDGVRRRASAGRSLARDFLMIPLEPGEHVVSFREG
jgi:hypothetical protein